MPVTGKRAPRRVAIVERPELLLRWPSRGAMDDREGAAMGTADGQEAKEDGPPGIGHEGSLTRLLRIGRNSANKMLSAVTSGSKGGGSGKSAAVAKPAADEEPGLPRLPSENRFTTFQRGGSVNRSSDLSGKKDISEMSGAFDDDDDDGFEGGANAGDVPKKSTMTKRSSKRGKSKSRRRRRSVSSESSSSSFGGQGKPASKMRKLTREDSLAEAPPGAGSAHSTHESTDEEDRLEHSGARIVQDFAPAHLVNFVMEAGSETAIRNTPFKKDLDAVVLFLKLQGFTQLTDKLKPQGRDGIEELGITMNRIFDRFSRLLGRKGGDIFKFSSDAVIVLWHPERKKDAAAAAGEVDLEMVACKAALCALQIQMELNGAKLCEDVTLSIKAGIGAGRSSVLHLGGDKARIECVLCGKALVQAFGCQSSCSPGETVVSMETWALIENRFAGEVLPNGCCRVLESTRRIRDAAIKKPALKSNMSIRLLQRYVPNAIKPYISCRSTWLTEVRAVSIICINLGFSAAELVDISQDELEHVQLMFKAIQEETYRLEGSVTKFLFDNTGSTVICAFGLPPVSHENDPCRAVTLALNVIDALRRIDVERQCYAGVATGSAFCGPIGSGSRREYAVLGAVVNSAKQLAMAAKEQKGTVQSGNERVPCVILCDKNCFAQSQRGLVEVNFARVEPSAFETGKERPVQTVFVPSWVISFQVLSARLARFHEVSDDTSHGMARPWDQVFIELLFAFDNYIYSRGQFEATVMYLGDPHCGKTESINQFSRSLQVEYGAEILHVVGSSVKVTDPESSLSAPPPGALGEQCPVKVIRSGGLFSRSTHHGAFVWGQLVLALNYIAKRQGLVGAQSDLLRSKFLSVSWLPRSAIHGAGEPLKNAAAFGRLLECIFDLITQVRNSGCTICLVVDDSQHMSALDWKITRHVSNFFEVEDDDRVGAGDGQALGLGPSGPKPFGGLFMVLACWELYSLPYEPSFQPPNVDFLALVHSINKSIITTHRFSVNDTETFICRLVGATSVDASMLAIIWQVTRGHRAAIQHCLHSLARCGAVVLDASSPDNSNSAGGSFVARELRDSGKKLSSRGRTTSSTHDQGSMGSLSAAGSSSSPGSDKRGFRKSSYSASDEGKLGPLNMQLMASKSAAVLPVPRPLDSSGRPLPVKARLQPMEGEEKVLSAAFLEACRPECTTRAVGSVLDRLSAGDLVLLKCASVLSRGLGLMGSSFDLGMLVAVFPMKEVQSTAQNDSTDLTFTPFAPSSSKPIVEEGEEEDHGYEDEDEDEDSKSVRAYWAPRLQMSEDVLKGFLKRIERLQRYGLIEVMPRPVVKLRDNDRAIEGGNYCVEVQPVQKATTFQLNDTTPEQLRQHTCSGSQCYRFANILIRDTIYQRSSIAQRKRLHNMCAQTFLNILQREHRSGMATMLKRRSCLGQQALASMITHHYEAKDYRAAFEAVQKFAADERWFAFNIRGLHGLIDMDAHRRGEQEDEGEPKGRAPRKKSQRDSLKSSTSKRGPKLFSSFKKPSMTMLMVPDARAGQSLFGPGGAPKGPAPGSSAQGQQRQGASSSGPAHLLTEELHDMPVGTGKEKPDLRAASFSEGSKKRFEINPPEPKSVSMREQRRPAGRPAPGGIERSAVNMLKKETPMIQKSVANVLTEIDKSLDRAQHSSRLGQRAPSMRFKLDDAVQTGNMVIDPSSWWDGSDPARRRGWLQMLLQALLACLPGRRQQLVRDQRAEREMQESLFRQLPSHRRAAGNHGHGPGGSQAPRAEHEKQQMSSNGQIIRKGSNSGLDSPRPRPEGDEASGAGAGSNGESGTGVAGLGVLVATTLVKSKLFAIRSATVAPEGSSNAFEEHVNNGDGGAARSRFRMLFMMLSRSRVGGRPKKGSATNSFKMPAGDHSMLVHGTPEALELLYGRYAARNLGNELFRITHELDSWDFDVFQFERFSRGMPLYTLTKLLFVKYGFNSSFRISMEQVDAFATKVEMGYPANPYHNSLHAADVLQSTHVLLRTIDVKAVPTRQPMGTGRNSKRLSNVDLGWHAKFTMLECLSLLIAAVVHDIRHPGVTTEFLIATKNKVALTFEAPQMEHFHVSVAKPMVAKLLSSESFANRTQILNHVCTLVLATSLQFHQSFLKELHSQQPPLPGAVMLNSEENREKLLKLIIKCADIGNCARNLELYKKWVVRIADEFLNQGEMERRAGLRVSKFMDRFESKMQLSFIDLVARPLYSTLKEYFPATAPFHVLVQENYFFWKHANRTKQNLHVRHSLSGSQPTIIAKMKEVGITPGSNASMGDSSSSTLMSGLRNNSNLRNSSMSTRNSSMHNSSMRNSSMRNSSMRNSSMNSSTRSRRSERQSSDSPYSGFSGGGQSLDRFSTNSLLQESSGNSLESD